MLEYSRYDPKHKCELRQDINSHKITFLWIPFTQMFIHISCHESLYLRHVSCFVSYPIADPKPTLNTEVEYLR